MLVVIENNKIKGIEKNLLNLLNMDLTELSEFVNIINLQIDSLTSKPLKIKNFEFEISEIEILSLENIKIFELTLISQEKEETTLSPKSQAVSEQNETEFSFEPKLSQEQLAEPEITLQPSEEFTLEPKISQEQQAEAEIKIQPNEEFSFEPKLSQEQPAEPEIALQPIRKESETKKEETHEIKITPTFEEEKQKTLLAESGSQKIETTKTPEKLEKLETQEEEIEISFEDDLEEIREILQLSKEEFDNSIKQELQKASNELGINLEDLEDWYEQLIDQIKSEKSTIYKYIKKEDYENLHKSYHKLKGAALNLRLSQIALILKKLDELSKSEEPIHKIKQITDDFYNLIEHGGQNKQTQFEKSPEKETIEKIRKDKFIEDIILQTIKSYLNTQNEAQFQKDKKYIEKLLDMKINSIEDLQNLIKGL